MGEQRRDVVLGSPSILGLVELEPETEYRGGSKVLGVGGGLVDDRKHVVDFIQRIRVVLFRELLRKDILEPVAHSSCLMWAVK